MLAQEWSWQSLAEPKGRKSERQQPDDIFGTPGYSYAWSPCQQGHFSHVSQETSLSRISVTCKQNNSHTPVLNKNKGPKEIPIHRQSLWNSRLLSDNDRYWIKTFSSCNIPVKSLSWTSLSYHPLCLTVHLINAATNQAIPLAINIKITNRKKRVPEEYNSSPGDNWLPWNKYLESTRPSPTSFSNCPASPERYWTPQCQK